MEENKNLDWSSLVFLVIILFIIAVGYKFWQDFTNKPESFISEDLSSYTTAKRDNWELTLYSSSEPNYLYEIDTIKGLVNKNACILEGRNRVTDKGSFECSYRCKTQYTEIQGNKDEAVICEKVCDESGNCR